MTNNILTNVQSVVFYGCGISLLNVKEMEFEASDAWLKIAVPYNPKYIHQQILPTAISIKMTCLNHELLVQVLTTATGINGHPLYNFTTNLRDISLSMVITTKETDGTTITITCANVHVETIKIDKLTEKVGEAEVIVQLHADNAVPS